MLAADGAVGAGGGGQGGARAQVQQVNTKDLDVAGFAGSRPVVIEPFPGWDALTLVQVDARFTHQPVQVLDIEWSWLPRVHQLPHQTAGSSRVVRGQKGMHRAVRSVHR